MAPARDKWVRRFIIPETARHKKGFTIYKVTSVVFLKSSHEEISKVSIWKRYNDFKKLHSDLSSLYSRSQIRESFPKFPKSKYFGRFEAEVIEERRQSALKFLDFIGRHSYLYSSDIFIKFFETSHIDHSSTDCSQSLSSDTSEDDRNTYLNSVSGGDTISRSIYQLPKSIQEITGDTCPTVAADNIDKIDSVCKNVNQSKNSKNLETNSTRTNVNQYMDDKTQVLDTKFPGDAVSNGSNFNDCASQLDNNQFANNRNNNFDKNTQNNIANDKHSSNVQTTEGVKTESIIGASRPLIVVHDGSDLSQLCPDSSQYILIAAAHMSCASTHEANAEYEEAFTQYKMGISSLLSGVQSDTDPIRTRVIKEKISKYLERAERLYHRHLNCNISLLSKPVNELQHYKVLKIMRSVMLVKDIRQNCLRIVKAVEKSSGNKESISNYILRGQVPYMVRLHAYVETEATVFLILQHLSRGRLWNFIMTQYSTHNDTICDIRSTESIDNSFGSNGIALRENGVKNGAEPECMIRSDFVSTSPKVQTNYSATMESNHEIFPMDLSTTQLLEKAQILLQSVNATLEASNSVVSRLKESKQLKSLQETTFLNMKNATYQPDSQDVITQNMNELSNEIFNVKRTVSQKVSTPIKTMPEKSVMNDSSPLGDENRNDKSPYITDSSSLTNSCTDLSLSERESSSYSLDMSKSVSSPVTSEQTSSDKTDDIYSHELIKSLKASCAEKTHSLSDSRVKNNNAWQIESTGNRIESEEECWSIPENMIRLWAAEILLALEALHQQEVIVFDLKPENILLDDAGHVQLTYIVPHHDTDLSRHRQPYASPELCLFLPTIPLTTATDIWSFGVILYELLVGNKFETNHPGLFHSHSIINIPNRLSENAKSLLFNVLKYEPNERMTIPEIKQHPFFDEIDWSSLVNPI